MEYICIAIVWGLQGSFGMVKNPCMNEVAFRAFPTFFAFHHINNSIHHNETIHNEVNLIFPPWWLKGSLRGEGRSKPPFQYWTTQLHEVACNMILELKPYTSGLVNIYRCLPQQYRGLQWFSRGNQWCHFGVAYTIGISGGSHSVAWLTFAPTLWWLWMRQRWWTSC